jgi:cytochrome c biogenesis protein CcmG/thiol:disulfide interchange protein DsbE
MAAWAKRCMVSVLATASALAASVASPLERGAAAPPCSAPLLDSSRAISVADYRGKVVYLDFWASWCAPCRESFPFMNALERELAIKGLAIVAVSVDKTAEDARRFVASHPARFVLAVDRTGACPAAYQLPGMPTSFIIDRRGVIRAVHAGFRASDAAEIRRQLSEALDER